MTRQFDKAKAVSMTRLSQVGFVVLACAAGAMAFVGLPNTTPPSDKDFAVASGSPIETPAGPKQATMDFAGSASRLLRVANAPKIAPPPEAHDAGTPEVAPPEPGLSDVKYLGFANVGSLKMALVVVNNKQRFVREGQALDAERVKLIDPDAVTLSKGESERRIPLQERGSERVTRMKPGPAADPNAVQQAKVSANARLQPQTIKGVRGLSKMPDEFEKWPGAYQRQFSRAVNRLLEQGEFPDEYSLIEKAKAMVKDEGYSPEDKDSMTKLEELEKASVYEKEKEANDGIPPEKRVPPEKQTPPEKQVRQKKGE